MLLTDSAGKEYVGYVSSEIIRSISIYVGNLLFPSAAGNSDLRAL